MESLNKEWDLKKYFYSGITDNNIQRDIDIYRTNVDLLRISYEDRLHKLEEDGFLEFLEIYDNHEIQMDKIFIYLYLISSLDTQNQAIQKETARIEKVYSDCQEKLLFINSEYKKIGFDKLIALSEKNKFKSYKNDLISTANNLKYSLSSQEERVYLKVSKAVSPDFYDEFTSSFSFDFNGGKVTDSEIRHLRQNSDRLTRKKAYKAIATVYSNKQNQIVLSNLYSIVCKENTADLELRKYKTVMSQRNVSEELSDETVDLLLKKVSDKYSLYHKFLKKKSKLVGIKKLNIFDTLTPLPSQENKLKFSFEDGCKLYMDTIKSVDEKLATFSEDMLLNGRISVYPKQGKTGGAYANYSKNVPEFILLNWVDSISDVSTLAHEMGHAFHGNLSKIQKSAVFHTPLTLAETASIFNETLMFETLLESVKNPEEYRKLIYDRLDDIFATIFRQIVYIKFEKRCHESFQNNMPLTAEDYNRIWVEENKLFYGKSIRIDSKLIETTWSSIPHIFQTPFYCYTYAFGNIISLNLYQNYKNSSDKKEFIEKYHQLLFAGGSDTPENLLWNIFKIKFDDSFYETAFQNIEDLLNKL